MTTQDSEWITKELKSQHECVDGKNGTCFQGTILIQDAALWV